MRVGILGSGLMGGKLGTLFARAGHDVVFSYARRSEKLKALARKAGGGARAGPGERSSAEETAVRSQSGASPRSDEFRSPLAVHARSPDAL